MQYKCTVCLLLLSDDNEHYEMAQLSSKTTPEISRRQGREPPIIICKDNENQPDEEEMKHPWQTLVSYVDELTVGGRKNSKGQYMDAMGNFPGFGKQKEPKVPETCFPRQCYNTYVFISMHPIYYTSIYHFGMDHVYLHHLAWLHNLCITFLTNLNQLYPTGCLTCSSY